MTESDASAEASVSAENASAGPSSGHRARSRTSGDRKSTRLNSSHGYISYAVFCLKKKKKNSNEIVTAHVAALDNHKVHIQTVDFLTSYMRPFEPPRRDQSSLRQCRDDPATIAST